MSLLDPHAQHAAHPAGRGLDLRPQRDRELAADGRERAPPWRVAGQIDLGAQPARRVVDVLEQRGLRHRLAAPQIGLELAHHPLEVGEHDRHRRRIGRLGDAGREDRCPPP